MNYKDYARGWHNGVTEARNAVVEAISLDAHRMLSDIAENPEPPRGDWDPLPWRPFHPEPLKGGPADYLMGAAQDTSVRAIMEMLEAEITSEADDLCRVGNELLERAAGSLEALRNFHATIKAAVQGGAL